MKYGRGHAFATALAVAIVLGATFAVRIDSCVLAMDCGSPEVPAAPPHDVHRPVVAVPISDATVTAVRAEQQLAQVQSIQLAELAKAEATWHRMRPRSYELVVRINCFCGMNESLIAHRVDGATPVLLERLLIFMPSEGDNRFDTVDHIFEWLRKSLAARPHILKVRFDRRLGYPINGQIDEKEMASDDYLFFEVVELVSIEP